MIDKKQVKSRGTATRYLSKELGSLKFNQRVLDQVNRPEACTAERLKFLSISAANLDEFFMVKVGRLYSYLDNQWEWNNKSEKELKLFVDQLLGETKEVFDRQHGTFVDQVVPALELDNSAIVQDTTSLSQADQQDLQRYFETTLAPILTPRKVHPEHKFPVLHSLALVLGVVLESDPALEKQVAFVQIPKNLPRFYPLREGKILIPLEAIVERHIALLFSGRRIQSVTLLRVTRNGNFLLDDNDDMEKNLVEELRRKLKKRNRSRVVRLEVAASYDAWLVDFLRSRWKLSAASVFYVRPDSLLDLTGVQSLIRKDPKRSFVPVVPLMLSTKEDLFAVLKKQDLLLHHPYNSIDVLLDFLDQAAEDPQVLAIKITIYRLAAQSAVVAALVKAALCGKHVVVFIEIKARFDEENNIKVAQELEEAGCLVIYGTSQVKVHAKMLMIFRQEQEHVQQYVHLSTGNYNEDTAKGYVDISLLTTEKHYAREVASFFNMITSDAPARAYENLLTAPFDFRTGLTALIRQEAANAREGRTAGIVIKVNALEDRAIIDELYNASAAGVPIHLIVRGVCCLVPQKIGLSEHITVRSIVGDLLEHARIFYFHSQGDPKIYAGSADMMVHSFERRVEVLFAIKGAMLQQQIVNILADNLRDNVNSYLMNSDGTYEKIVAESTSFDIHASLPRVVTSDMVKSQLF